MYPAATFLHHLWKHYHQTDRVASSSAYFTIKTSPALTTHQKNIPLTLIIHGAIFKLSTVL